MKNILEPGRPGRRSKLTPELEERIINLIKAGNYIEVACAACGISDSTYYNWMNTGKEWDGYWQNYQGPLEEDEWVRQLGPHEQNCLRFFRSVKQATAEAEAYAVGIVRKHMPDQWTAAMTYLERRFPGRWKRRDEHSISPFHPQIDQGTAVDETALLNNQDAMNLMHEALRTVAEGDDVKELPASSIEDEDDHNETGT